MPPHFMWTQKLHSSHCIDLWFVATGFWHIPHGKRIGPGLLCISIASISVSNRNNLDGFALLHKWVILMLCIHKFKLGVKLFHGFMFR
jgi:hypothetical protein